MTLADKIVVLRDGRVEQVGSPITLYERPENTFVAQFIGSPKMNFFAPSTLSPSAPKKLKSANDDDLVIGIRPEHFRVTNSKDSVVRAKLELVENLGEHALVHLVCDDGSEFIAKTEAPPAVAKGDYMDFTAPRELIHTFDKATGQ